MYTIMVKARVQSIKDPKLEEPKTQSLEKSTLYHSNNFEYSGRAWKEKRKNWHNWD